MEEEKTVIEFCWENRIFLPTKDLSVQTYKQAVEKKSITKQAFTFM